MSEDTILTIIAGSLIIGAYSIGYFFRNSRGIHYFKILMSPFSWLKDRVDPNYWASRIGNRKGGVYEKARNSRIRKWSEELEGWNWLAYQIVVCGFFFVIIEILLNIVGLTMIPW